MKIGSWGIGKEVFLMYNVQIYIEYVNTYSKSVMLKFHGK